MKYACDKCDFVTSWKNGIRTHQKKNHDDIHLQNTQIDINSCKDPLLY